MLTFDQIKELIDRVAELELGGLEYERSGFRLRIDGRASSGAAPPEPREERRHQVTSQIVGTFYRAPAPDAEPFVEVGQKVSEGQVLCIVEAMKLLNEIKSDVDGTVVEVLAENGQAVQFGDPLFDIRIDG